MVLSRLDEHQATQSEPFADLAFPEFCETYLRVQDKTGAIVPLRLNRAQRTLIDNLTGRDIVLKARQLGMSTVIQAYLFWRQLQGGARTDTLCHENQLTSTLRRMVDRYYFEIDEAIRPVRKYANAQLTSYAELNSEGSIATVGGTAGMGKGRGGSMTHIHGSEVAFWPDAEAVVGGALQAGNPSIVLESTPNGMRGWFYEQCMGALDGDSIWRLHFFPWWWDDDYRLPVDTDGALDYTPDEQRLVDAHGLDAEQIAWRRRKQRELGRLFPQEYPEDPYSCFLASGIGYFGDLTDVFTAPTGTDPQKGHRYYAGLDWGQAQDYTTVSVIDRTTMREVAVYRKNQLPWSELRREVRLLCDRWGVLLLTVEENSMSAAIEELRREFEQEHSTTRIVTFNTTNLSKYSAAVNFHEAIHEEGLKLLPDPASHHEMAAFEATQTATGLWRLAAPSGEHDDTVIAKLLAWHGAKGRTSITTGAVELI